MAVCCYVEGVAVCLLIIAVTITAQEDRDYLNTYRLEEEDDTPNLNEFLQNVLNHKDDFKWIERRAKNLNLPDIGRYEKDIEPRIRKTQLVARSRRKPTNDLSYLDYNDNDYEDAIRRTYRRVPGGFHGRKPRRNRLLNPNRNKRRTNSELNYDYETNLNDVQVYPESQYGVLNTPGDKYDYKSKRMYRRYMQDDLHSPFFSDPNDEDTIIIDDTPSQNHHDILGLKKYRERNRKKIAEKDFGGIKLYKKRSLNRFNDTSPFRTYDYLLKPAPVSDTFQYNTFQQNNPLANLSFQINSGPFSKIINDAVGFNLRNYDESRRNINNTSADEEKMGEISNTHSCGVKKPITSHFEGLVYPNIQDVIGNMSANHNVARNEQKDAASSSETAIVAKNINVALENEETTLHVNYLDDVTHPTSAIEQRILAINNGVPDQDVSTSTVTNSDNKRASESLGFDKLYFYNGNESQRIIEKSVPNNPFRVKGSRLPTRTEGKSKNFAALFNDQHKQLKEVKSLEYNEGYDDYGDDEENYKREGLENSDSDNYYIKHQDKKQSPDLNENPQYHARHLLNLEDKDCTETDQSLCPTDKKRGLPDFLGMSKEEDYKDDDIMGKQLLKKSNTEGDDEYANADPYLDKKVKYTKKKKENESRNSKNIHALDRDDQESIGGLTLTPAPVEENIRKEVKLNENEKDDDRSIKLCGTGNNKVYCNMKDEKEDDNFANKLKIMKGGLKKKYSNFRAHQEDFISKENEKHDNLNYFYPSKLPSVEELNQTPLDKNVKVILSQVMNPPNNIMEDQPYEVKKFPSANNKYETYSDHIFSDILPQAPETKNSLLMSRDSQDNNNNALKMKEERKEDIIETGFKKKLATTTDIRLKRRNKLRTYLDKLRLNKKKKSNWQQERHHKPQNDYGQAISLAPKYDINFLGRSQQDDVSIRKQRSYQQPYNLQYPAVALNRRNPAPTVSALVNVTARQVSSIPVVQRVTEIVTEIYPSANNKKAPFQYVEYQKEKSPQVKSTLNTEIAAAIVDQIIEAINAHHELGVSIGRGICKQTERQKNIQDLTNIDKNATKTDLSDTQHILESLMVAINKIIEEKVKSRLCRKLPPPLQNYLKTIVNIPKPHNRGQGADASAENLPLPQIKTREATEDHPEVTQSDFLFYKEDNETPEIKRRHIRNKLRIIKSLLEEYKQMSNKCKVRMRFVRDYLEKNLAILQLLYDKCKEEETYKSQRALPQKEKKHTAHPKGSTLNNGSDSQRSIDEQLEKIGWDNRKEKLLTDSDVEKIVRQSMGKEKREVNSASDENRRASKQYKTLVNAVEKMRQKQEKEEKLAKLFGEKRSVRNENYETIRSNNKEAQTVGQLSFKEPVVFSMDN